MSVWRRSRGRTRWAGFHVKQGTTGEGIERRAASVSASLAPPHPSGRGRGGLLGLAGVPTASPSAPRWSSLCLRLWYGRPAPWDAAFARRPVAMSVPTGTRRRSCNAWVGDDRAPCCSGAFMSVDGSTRRRLIGAGTGGGSGRRVPPARFRRYRTLPAATPMGRDVPGSGRTWGEASPAGTGPRRQGIRQPARGHRHPAR
jgi:hypothetical protein